MATIDTLNYLLEQQFNFRIKLIILCVMTVICLYGIYHFKNKEPQMLWEWQMKIIVPPICKTYLFISPLYIFLLSMDVEPYTFLKLMLVAYIAGLFLSFMFVLIFGGEKIKIFFTGEGFHRARFKSVAR